MSSTTSHGFGDPDQGDQTCSLWGRLSPMRENGNLRLSLYDKQNERAHLFYLRRTLKKTNRRMKIANEDKK